MLLKSCLIFYRLSDALREKYRFRIVRKSKVSYETGRGCGQKTHYPLYKTIRDANPTTPILFMTMPGFENWKDRPSHKARRKVILDTWKKAKEDGDNNVYFIDCMDVLGIKTNVGPWIMGTPIP